MVRRHQNAVSIESPGRLLGFGVAQGWAELSTCLGFAAPDVNRGISWIWSTSQSLSRKVLPAVPQAGAAASKSAPH